MPSIRYINQSAPFWDFVANLENQDFHPFNNPSGSRDETSEGPWGGWPFGRQLPGRFRGHHGGPHHGGPLNQEAADNNAGPSNAEAGEKSTENEKQEAGNENQPKEDCNKNNNCNPPPYRRGCHGYRGGRCGGGSGDFNGRRRCGGGPRGFPMMGGMPPAFAFGGPIAEFLQSQIFGDADSNNTNNNNRSAEGGSASSGDFTPEADVFDTEGAFVVHVSLPGAKKEDVGVNWDGDKSELSVAGVIYRPGDEEFIKNLALNDRKVGAFERKIRLGTRANPAQIDVDAITARLEDGVLLVEVPKLDKDYVEIKKVDIE